MNMKKTQNIFVYGFVTVLLIEEEIFTLVSETGVSVSVIVHHKSTKNVLKKDKICNMSQITAHTDPNKIGISQPACNWNIDCKCNALSFTVLNKEYALFYFRYLRQYNMFEF